MKRARVPSTLGATLVAAVTLALAAPAAPAAEPGVVLSTFERGDKNARFGAVSALHARWVRLFVDWSVVEPAPGRLESFWLDAYDDALKRLDGAGVKTLFVVTGAPSWASGSGDVAAPPRDPGSYASFVAALARRYKGKVEAYEIWNEQDESHFWRGGPDPVRYTELLKAAHAGIKGADPRATVVLGGLTGNNYEFLEKLYSAGAKGSFDAVGVHTDTACLTKPPDDAYREQNGRIGRFAFTGYREVRASMLANGDDKPIWMTELGWSTTSETCARGAFAGQKPGGVNETDQSVFLSKAYHCLASDPFVQVAIWFNLQDRSGNDIELDRYGLMRSDGSHKPAFAAFSSFGQLGDTLVGPCGPLLNGIKPIVTVTAPTPGAVFFDHLPIAATATDDIKVNRIEFAADGQRIRPFSGGATQLDWQGARNLSFGPHKLTVTAFDEQRNAGVVTIDVVRVNPKAMSPVPTGTVLAAKANGTGRTRKVSGQVSAPSVPLLRITGKALVKFDRFDKKKKRWVTTQKYFRNASKPFDVGVQLKKAGLWRVSAEYAGDRPFKRSRSRFTSFKVK